MNHKLSLTTASIVAVTLLAAGIASAVLAQSVSGSANASASANVPSAAAGLLKARVNATTSAGAGAGANGTIKAAAISRITDRADQEITRRLAALNALSSRVGEMARLSAAEKTSLSSSIQAQITAMNDLRTKVAADASANDTTTLKSDVQSITASYRIFALVLPQGAIEAAADRVLTITSIMSDLSSKLSTRLSAAANAGNNVSASETALADMNAKISDANTQAQAANSEVASLTPDNGSSTAMQANTAALKDARAKIKVAQQDLMTARTDAMTIVQALGTYKVSATSTTSASANVQ